MVTETHEFKFEESKPFYLTELAEIEAEIGDSLPFNLDEKMTDLFWIDLLDLIDSGNFSAVS